MTNLTSKDEIDIVNLYKGGSSLSAIRIKYKCGQRKLNRILDAAGMGKDFRVKRKNSGPRNTSDITGQRFGRLIALKDVGSEKGRRIWEFLCDCGKKIKKPAHYAISGKTKSCGCLKIDSLQANKTNHTGKRYGYLVATEFVKRINNSTHWRFNCDCGNSKYDADINAIRNRAKKGELVSCGCGTFNKAAYKDFSGFRFGMLVAVQRIKSAEYGGSIWKWKCDCGNFVERTQSSVKASGGYANCGCQTTSKAKERTGERFGNLVAIKLLENLTKRRKNSSSTTIYWLMQCDCGNQIPARINDCVTGRKLSCGCIQKGWDKVENILDNTFYKAEEDHYFYVFSMRNYTDQTKLGISEDLEDRVLQSRGEYGEIHNYFELPRVESWLIEQALLRFTQIYWKPPSRLMQEKWPGYTELRKLSCSEIWSMAETFYDDLKEMGRYLFAAEYLIVSPNIKKELEKMAEFKKTKNNLEEILK